MLTKKQKRILKHLILNSEPKSINQIARDCSLSPNGAYKILKGFQNYRILKTRKIANIISYNIDYNNIKTKPLLQLTIIEDLEKRIESRKNDLKPIEKFCKACIIFGSYLQKNKKPNDLDILVIIKKEKFKKYKKALKETVTPVKIHDIVQTEKDLKDNLEELKVIIEQGIVLWGHEKIIEAVIDVQKDQGLYKRGDER